MNTDVRAAESGVAITPSDTVRILQATRAVYVGVSGDVAVVWADGSSSVLKNAPVGERPWRIIGVKATGTTATDMVALY